MLDNWDSNSDSGGSILDSSNSVLESRGSSAITFRDVVQVHFCFEHGALQVVVTCCASTTLLCVRWVQDHKHMWLKQLLQSGP